MRARVMLADPEDVVEVEEEVEELLSGEHSFDTWSWSFL